MAPSCFVAGYDRSAQIGQHGHEPASPMPKTKRSLMKKLATQGSGNNDSFKIEPTNTGTGWTKLEPIPHQDGWSDHNSDMSI